MISLSDFQRNKLLSDLSTFKIGGPADYFIEVKEGYTLSEVIKFCLKQKMPYFILGRGSNCIFDDAGFRGVIILNKIDFFEQNERFFTVGAGYNFSLLGTQTAKKGFAGLEFACGIPASVGGAIYMNAGANGNETCDTLFSVEFLHENGRIETFKREDLKFSYRHSPFQELKGAILSATFELEKGPHARHKQIEIVEYRKKTQPLSEPSCGCIFKNPKGANAGGLIEKAMLKGLSCGGVKVSEKHANFIVNSNNGTAQDVLDLIALIKCKVKEKTGFDLQEEIRVIKSF